MRMEISTLKDNRGEIELSTLFGKKKEISTNIQVLRIRGSRKRLNKCVLTNSTALIRNENCPELKWP